MTKIFILYTGGTIGMVHDAHNNALMPFNFGAILDQVPELRRFGFEIDAHSFSPLLDSSNITPAVWVEMARIIEKKYDQYDGFVILHGTDTMAYTASALSFMFENLGKPVIMTGSQLPIGEIRTDAKENLITAIELAASREPVVNEVCILFDFQLYRGNRATKFNSIKFEAFRSVNYPVLAEAGVEIRYHEHAILPKIHKPFRVNTKLNEEVGLLKLYPGIPQAMIDAVLQTTGLKALVLETFGAGNASTNPDFIESLRKAIQKGMLILDVTQCLGGRVELGRYQTSVQLQSIGVISGEDITTEAALAKLMYLLGQDLTDAELKQQLAVSLRGEISV